MEKKIESRWARGKTWKVNIQEGLLELLNVRGETTEYYEPIHELHILRDFAQVGQLELTGAGEVFTIDHTRMSDSIRNQLEEFSLAYGPLFDWTAFRTSSHLYGRPFTNPENQGRSYIPVPSEMPLPLTRDAAAYFAAAWNIWKALSNGDAAALPFKEEANWFDIYGKRINGVGRRSLNLPDEYSDGQRHEFLVRLVLSELLLEMWEWEYVKPPAEIPGATLEGFVPSQVYFSLFGDILQQFTDVVLNGSLILECPHPLCGKDFIPLRTNQFHCDRYCREAHKQKRLRERRAG